MAILQDLPIELLHTIIELAVEDAIAVDSQYLSRRILLSLSLVSKDFTLPSQSILWRNIRIDNSDSTRALGANETAEGKIVEELKLFVYYEKFTVLEVLELKTFLNKVKRVESLTLHVNSKLVNLNDLFEIHSLKELKSLAFYGRVSSKVASGSQLPSLQHLTITDFTSKSDNVLSRIIESSSNTLSSLALEKVYLTHYSLSKTSISIFSLASGLKVLRISDCDQQLPLDLLPLCSSLKSLALDSVNTSFETIVSRLSSLSKSTRLDILFIYVKDALQGFEDEVADSLVGSEEFTSFVSALDLPQLIRLQHLYLDIVSQPGSRESQAIIELLEERVDFIEKLEKRGIQLFFDKEEDVRFSEEKEKQRIYKVRQADLDMESK